MKYLIVMGLCILCSGTAAAGTDNNIEIMLNAAKSLEYTFPENRAYLLIKQETVVSPVAVVFGYMDNHAACLELAGVLSSSGSVGTFQCSAIY